jgi:hypothetical protein
MIMVMFFKSKFKFFSHEILCLINTFCKCGDTFWKKIADPFDVYK